MNNPEVVVLGIESTKVQGFRPLFDYRRRIICPPVRPGVQLIHQVEDIIFSVLILPVGTQARGACYLK